MPTSSHAHNDAFKLRNEFAETNAGRELARCLRDRAGVQAASKLAPYDRASGAAQATLRRFLATVVLATTAFLSLTVTTSSAAAAAEKSAEGIAVGHAFPDLTAQGLVGNLPAELKGKIVIVDFWAPWCGPCRQLTPIIDRLADQFAGKVKVGKLNVDDAQDLAVYYGITNIPRVYIFKNGEPVERIVGLRSEADLTKTIKAVLEK